MRVDLLADLVAAAAGARAERGGDRARRRRPRAAPHALVDDPARQRLPAAVQRGDRAVGGEQDRQAVGGEDDRRGVGQRGRLAVLLACRAARARRRLGGAPDGRAVHLAPVTEARPRMADRLPQPAPVLGDVLGRVVGQHARGSARRTGPRTRRRARSRRRPARAAGRRRSGRSPSGRRRFKHSEVRAARQLRLAVRRAAVEQRDHRARQPLADLRRRSGPAATRSSPEIESLRWRIAVEPALRARVARGGQQLDGLDALAAQKAPHARRREPSK